MASLSDLLAHCIRCGFCLESCPTFVLTGEESESPRGRIYLIRAAVEGDLDWKAIAPHIDLCLGCRACEIACPSGVEYGAILELARENIPRSKKQEALLVTVSNSSLLRASLSAAKLAGGLVKVPKPQSKPDWPPVEAEAPTLGKIVLLGGCAMKTLFPRAHEASRRLLLRAGWDVLPSGVGCCGALHAHAGDRIGAERRLESLLKASPPEAPIVTDSAGCGSHLKEALAGKRRVMDLTEALLCGKLVEKLRSSHGFEASATYHDACHLANGQRLRTGPRELLGAVPGLTLVEMEEPDRCCGSAGIYSSLQPEMAARLRERKIANIRSTGAPIVVAGNPGCHAWIAQGAPEGIRVMHTAEVLESAFLGLIKD